MNFLVPVGIKTPELLHKGYELMNWSTGLFVLHPWVILLLHVALKWRWNFTESKSCEFHICLTSKRPSESHSRRHALQRTQLRPGSSVRGELYTERQHRSWFLMLKGFFGGISALYFLPIVLPSQPDAQRPSLQSALTFIDVSDL